MYEGPEEGTYLILKLKVSTQCALKCKENPVKKTKHFFILINKNKASGGISYTLSIVSLVNYCC